MPRTRSLGWAELKIGVLAVTALAIAIVIIFSVGQQGGFFWQLYALRTTFDDIQGLKEGAVVRLAGVEVGTVETIRFEGALVEVRMELGRDMQSRVTTESRASIGSLSLLGEPVIDITPSTEGEPLLDGGYLESAPSGGQLSDVAERATRGLEEATSLLQDVRQGKGAVGKLFTDDTLYQELLGFVEAAGAVATNLNDGRGTIGALLQDPAAYQALESSLTHLNGVMARLDAGEGSLGQLVTDDAFATSLTSTVTSFGAVGDKMNQGEGTLGRLVNDDVLYERLSSFSGRLDELMARLNEGEGTAGQLLRDRQLYENMSGAVGEIRNLVADVRNDPKKYLNVKVSIF